MSKIGKIFLGLLMFVFLIISIIFPKLLIPYVILVALTIIKIYFNRRNKRLALENQIPLELLQKLETAERRWGESNGTRDTQQILWDIARESSPSIRRFESEKSRIGAGNISSQSERRQELQNNDFAEHASNQKFFESNSYQSGKNDGRTRRRRGI